MSLHIKPEQVCRSLLGVLNRSTEWRQLKVKNRKTFYEALSSSLLELPNQMSQMEEKIAKNSSWGGGGRCWHSLAGAGGPTREHSYQGRGRRFEPGNQAP